MGGHNICYTCYDDLTFRFHGQTAKFPKLLRDYVDGIVAGEEINCIACGCRVNYTREGENWRENIIAKWGDE